MLLLSIIPEKSVEDASSRDLTLCFPLFLYRGLPQVKGIQKKGEDFLRVYVQLPALISSLSPKTTASVWNARHFICAHVTSGQRSTAIECRSGSTRCLGTVEMGFGGTNQEQIQTQK